MRHTSKQFAPKGNMRCVSRRSSAFPRIGRQRIRHLLRRRYSGYIRRQAGRMAAAPSRHVLPFDRYETPRVGWLLIARSLAQNKQSLVTTTNKPKQPEIRSGQVRSGQIRAIADRLAFPPYQFRYCISPPVGCDCVCCHFRRYSLLVVWPAVGCGQVADDSVPDSASSGSSSAAPLTASHRSCKVGILLREGRRRHSSSRRRRRRSCVQVAGCCLVGLTVCNVLCCAFASPQLQSRLVPVLWGSC